MILTATEYRCTTCPGFFLWILTPDGIIPDALKPTTQKEKGMMHKKLTVEGITAARFQNHHSHNRWFR